MPLAEPCRVAEAYIAQLETAKVYQRDRDPGSSIEGFLSSRGLPSGLCGAPSEQPVHRVQLYDQTRRIITSVALISAAAVCPAFNCISRAELAVMIDVMCWPPIEILTSAIRPLMRTESMRPTS